MFGHIIGGAPDADYHGATLTADLAIGATVLHVNDTSDFDEDAVLHNGKVILGADSTAEGAVDSATGSLVPYSTCDEDTLTVTLAAPSTVAASAGDLVYILDPATSGPVVDYTVLVELDSSDPTGDALRVTLTHGLIDSVGTTDDLSGQSITFDEDEDGELIASDLPGSAPSAGVVRAMQDQMTVSVPGDQLLNLSFRPMPNSEHLYWNGVYQPGSEWSRDKWTVTIPDGAGYLEAGDQLVMEYLYTDPTLGDPIECRQVTVTPGSVSVHGPTGLPANPGSVVVGGGNQWADGSDATYGTETTGSTMGYFGTSILDAPLPTLTALGIDPATVKSGVVRCRVSSSVTGLPFVPYVADNDEDAATVSADFGDFLGPLTSDTPGAVLDAVLPLKGSTLADLIAALSGPAPRLAFVTSSGTPDFTVYEASVELTVCKPASEWVATDPEPEPLPDIVIDVPATQATLTRDSVADGWHTEDVVDISDPSSTIDFYRYFGGPTGDTANYLAPTEFGGHDANTLDWIPATPDGYALADVRPYVIGSITGAPQAVEAASGWHPPAERAPFIGVTSSLLSFDTFSDTYDAGNPKQIAAANYDPSFATIPGALADPIHLVHETGAQITHILLQGYGFRFTFTAAP